jgi:hypothetical protein
MGIATKKNSTDNYRFANYIIVKEVMENIIIWKFIWGFPPDLNRLINYIVRCQ